MPAPRVIRPEEQGQVAPIYAVWELTLACDHACAHCGSRAGEARTDELTTAEALDIADQLAELGIREVTLIGGEAYLRQDCVPVIERIVARGMRATMQTGGRGFTEAMARKLAMAGLSAVGVSIDGLEATHDELRDAKGSWRGTMRALDSCRAAGLISTVNTQVNRKNLGELRGLREVLRQSAVKAWRMQLTVPMGRAADRPDWILQPWQILDLIDDMAAMQLEEVERVRAMGLEPSAALRISAGNNVGYHGPNEVIVRSNPGGSAQWWQGCKAGMHTLGIESDGTLKPCPSLPTAPYVAGNLRDTPLDELWQGGGEIGFARERTVDELWGFCKTCDYADSCRAGCSFTAHCTLGRRGNMPWCYHRAATLKKRGLRERLVRVEEAEGVPYDFGRFELVEEAWTEGSAP